MDLDITGEQNTQLDANSLDYIATKNERTVSDTFNKIIASSSMKDKKERTQMSLSSNPSLAQIQEKGDVIPGNPALLHKRILGRIPCLVTGCKNNGGKGYTLSSIRKHIQSHKAILLQSAEEREKVTRELEKYGNRVLCKGCCMVVCNTNNKWLCRSCASLDEVKEVSSSLTDNEKGLLSKQDSLR